MEQLNQNLFLWLNYSAHPSQIIVNLAIFFAEYSIFLIPIFLITTWLRGDESTRKLLLEAVCAGLVGLLINQIISALWQHPRPFMMGLGRTLIPHVADSSFPSDHLTLLWCVSFSLLRYQPFRSIGAVFSLLGLPMAWARIYLGVHFPFDIVGAILIAIVSAWLSYVQSGLYLPFTYKIAINIHHILLKNSSKSDE
ncbi:undecaprenyl-diphosphatase [Undibacterium sp. Rencai35W]|uniref:undecaprenyl-diphosphatase n=1 Tax=Undibacterium sp. Rencai35W TaxID=3413046 RepID=UPI003BF0067B